MDAHAHRLRLHRKSLAHHTYDICICCDRREPHLASDAVSLTVQEGLFGLLSRGIEIMEGYVLMPDHLHVIFKLGGDQPLEVVLREFKKYTALRANRVLRRTGAFWQEGYRDRVIRSQPELRARLEYILANPIRAGLSRQMGEYPWARCGPWDRLTVTRGQFFGRGR